MGSGERARVRFFQKICLSVGVSEIEKNEEKAKSSDLRQNFDSQCPTNEWRSHQKSES